MILQSKIISFFISKSSHNILTPSIRIRYPKYIKNSKVYISKLR